MLFQQSTILSVVCAKVSGLINHNQNLRLGIERLICLYRATVSNLCDLASSCVSLYLAINRTALAKVICSISPAENEFRHACVI